MKNSAWYHKLWRDKLGELPLKKDDVSAWAEMSNLLDEQLPIANATSTGKTAYKLSTFVKTALVLIIATIIIVPAIRTYKHHTNSAKNNKHLPARVTGGHNVPDKPSDNPSNQHLKDLTISDSTLHHSDGFAESIIQNQKDAANSSTISNKSIAVNRNRESLNTTGKTVKAKQYQPIDKFENGNLLNGTLASGKAGPSQYMGSKSNSKPTGIVGTRDKQKSQYSPISLNRSPAYYTSVKYNHVNAAKSTLKTDASGKDTAPVNNADGKAITASNTTVGSAKSSNLNNDKEAADTKIDPVKNPANNTGTKEVKNPGSRSRVFDTAAKTVKAKENKFKSNTKKPKDGDPMPKYDYGLQAGLNAGNGNSLYAGAFGSYQTKPRWLINLGLRLNTYRTVSGEYSHQSYYSPDSIPAFKINDSRKVMALTISVTLEYKLTKNISLKGGPVIGMPIKQSGISAKLGAVPNIRDTVYHTQTIDSALKKTTINKLNIGFTGGASIQIKHFSIEAMYQVLTPYKVSSGLGSYQKTNQNFQIGIGYRFK
jgi:hypothetical protein